MHSMQTNSCRLCGSKDLNKCLDLPRSTQNISKLLTKEELENDKPVNIQVFQCGDCRFVQLINTLEDDFYDEYIMTVSHSELMNNFQLEQAEYFVSKYNLRDATIIELGCGDGNFLSHLKTFAHRSIGLEPSNSFRKLAVEKGHKVLSEYVTAEKSLDGAPYDAFITREVLEHVPYPNDFLKAIRKSLAPNAIGLVEVPCLEKAIKYNRFYDFFADHLNYFTLSTLRFALEKNGFRVLELMHGMNEEFNIAIVQNTGENEFGKLQQSVEEVCGSINTEIKNTKGKVAVYGSGAKGLTVLANAGITEKEVAFVMDADPHKQGLFTQVSHLPVVSPDILRSQQPDLIIITAMAYKDEIIDTLRNKYNYLGKLMALDTNNLKEV